ncbi:MAG: glucosidase [Chlamydiota bacterium]
MTEKARLAEQKGNVPPWYKWGPYVSERSWGTVREDYSAEGQPWSHFSYAAAPFRCYRWGEDGIAGLCDRYQVLVLNHAFWNGKDPILKERLYGVGTHEANHGEDVKEYYYHLDNLPSHAYMRYLYKYPCLEYPYESLFFEGQQRGPREFEYELIDTGIFTQSRYFDIEIEYAKASAEDICIRVTFMNRSQQEETTHYLAQLFFRNTWSWGPSPAKMPRIEHSQDKDCQCLIADDAGVLPIQRLTFDYQLGKRYLYADSRAQPLFTNNETNRQQVFGEKNQSPYVRDAFHRYVVLSDEAAINREQFGTKAAFYFPALTISPKQSMSLLLRFSNKQLKQPLDGVERIIAKRKKEADRFYESIHPKKATAEERMIQRQALSGMLWNKQIYLYDVNLWIRGDNPAHPAPDSPLRQKSAHWKHLISKRILSMPDKWEYPWFAAWDLAFHCLSLALVDREFAKDQLWYLLFDQFQHPNGQIPAYEWEFSALNPPVQGWAALRLFKLEEKKTGKRDITFLKKCFHKLILNFVWWVNKVDAKGNNVFEGGFLGLDNITVIDRNQEIPSGGTLEQSDGTGWMGFFCLNLMRISLELAYDDPVYEGLAVKFFEHFVYIAHALVNAENRKIQNWSEEDGFFYDVINYPDGTQKQIKVRSLVGIIPLYAVDCITEKDLSQFKEFATSFTWFIENRADICANCVTPLGKRKKNYLLTLMDLKKVKSILKRVWDPGEFRSVYGVRSLSKFYQDHPYSLLGNTIAYQPGETEASLMGGNSNWRGPIWFPTSFLLVEALRTLDRHLGSKIQVSAADEPAVTSGEMARYFADGLINLFRLDSNGRRPIYGNCEQLQSDPLFRDHLLFFEHYHGDDGRGLGASHQTGWTGLVANLIDEWLSE